MNEIKQVTARSELSQIQLQRASMQRYECVHILTTYFLPLLHKAALPSTVVDLMKMMRDVFFSEYCLLDFNEVGVDMVIEKKSDNFNIVLAKRDVMIIYSNHLTIKSPKIYQEYGFEDNEKNTLKMQSVSLFAQKLQRYLQELKYKYLGLQQKIDAISDLMHRMCYRSMYSSSFGNFEICYARPRTTEDGYFIYRCTNRELQRFELEELHILWISMRRMPEYRDLLEVLGTETLVGEYLTHDERAIRLSQKHWNRQ